MPKRETRANAVTSMDLLRLLDIFSLDETELVNRRAMLDGARSIRDCLVLCRTYQEGVQVGVRPENVLPLDRLERMSQRGRRQPLLVDLEMMVDILDYAVDTIMERERQIREFEKRIEQLETLERWLLEDD